MRGIGTFLAKVTHNGLASSFHLIATGWVFKNPILGLDSLETLKILFWA